MFGAQVTEFCKKKLNFLAGSPVLRLTFGLCTSIMNSFVHFDFSVSHVPVACL